MGKKRFHDTTPGTSLGLWEDPDLQPTKKYSGSGFRSCYETHPAVPLLKGMFYGGSCSTPMIENADVYIGFDWGMRPRQSLPWQEKRPTEVYYPVADRHAPDNPKTFIKLIDWAAEQLEQGRVVHAGCIGGHGRTGAFLAALWKVTKNHEDAITAIRKAYCHKAVESSAQVAFLTKHFGITSVDGTDSAKYKGSSGSKSSSWTAVSKSWGSELKTQPKTPPTLAFSNATTVYTPVKSLACIWGAVI